MKITLTNKGDVNAADSVEFATFNNDQLMLSMNTYESFALLNRDEARKIAESLLHFANTGRILRPNG